MQGIDQKNEAAKLTMASVARRGRRTWNPAGSSPHHVEVRCGCRSACRRCWQGLTVPCRQPQSQGGVEEAVVGTVGDEMIHSPRSTWAVATGGYGYLTRAALATPACAGVGGGLGAWPPHALGTVSVQVHDVLRTVPAVDAAARIKHPEVRREEPDRQAAEEAFERLLAAPGALLLRS